MAETTEPATIASEPTPPKKPDWTTRIGLSAIGLVVIATFAVCSGAFSSSDRNSTTSAPTVHRQSECEVREEYAKTTGIGHMAGFDCDQLVIDQNVCGAAAFLAMANDAKVVAVLRTLRLKEVRCSQNDVVFEPPWDAMSIHR